MNLVGRSSTHELDQRYHLEEVLVPASVSCRRVTMPEDDADAETGRKLAELEMKLLMVLIIWNFELLPIPQSLAGFDAEDVVT
jgi:hypothetical protein